MAEAAWEMIQEEKRSTLPWPFGPHLNERELDLRRKLERSAELLDGRDPRSVALRYEAARKRRLCSTGRRIRFVFEMEGGVECIRSVIEDVKQIHKGGGKEMGNGAAAQIWDEKLAVHGDAPAIAAPTGQSSEEKEGSDDNASAFAVAAGQIGGEKEAAIGDVPAAAQIRETQLAGAVVRV